MSLRALLVALTLPFMVVCDAFGALYSNPECTEKVGSTSYSISDRNCFTNGGQYFKMDNGNTSYTQFSLEQHPGSPGNCGNNDNLLLKLCYTTSAHQCIDLNAAGFKTGGDGAGYIHSIPGYIPS